MERSFQRQNLKKNPRPRRYFTSILLWCFVLFYSRDLLLFCFVHSCLVAVIFLLIVLLCLFFGMYALNKPSLVTFCFFLTLPPCDVVSLTFIPNSDRETRERERHSQKQTEVLTSLLLRQSLIDLFTTDWLYILFFVPCFCTTTCRDSFNHKKENTTNKQTKNGNAADTTKKTAAFQ